MKKVIAFITLVIILATTNVFAVDTWGGYNVPIDIDINGSLIKCVEKPIMIDSTTYIPLRAFSDAIGGKISWDDNAKVVTLNEATQITVPHLAGNTVDVICDGKFVGKYKADEEGLIVFSKPLTGKVEIGLPFRSYVQSNFLEVAQMGSGVGKLKRLASMVVRVLDTPEVTINGETQKGTGKGVEDIHFYGIGDWDEKPTWEFTQNTPYKFNVLAAQMDLNYQLSTESY